MNVAYGRGGLAPAIVQHADTAQVLMLGYVNAESLTATQRTGLVHFWSRSRDALWKKGETSGNTLAVVVGHRHEEELAHLTDVEPVCYASAPYAGGILQAIDYYDFHGKCIPPQPPAEPEG